jgi:hypothetical protein
MVLEDKIASFVPTKFNKFYWWRRFKPREILHHKVAFRDRVANGDFEISDYHYHIMWENKLEQDAVSKVNHVDAQHEIRGLFGERKRRLIADYEKDQFKIDDEMYKLFWKEFRLKQNEVEEKMLDFDGTLHEFVEDLYLAKYTSYIHAINK